MSEFFYELWNLYDGEEYQTLNFTPDSLRLVFLFLWIGAVVAFIMSYYSNHYLGSFVEKLISEGACSKQSAKTLAELNISSKSMLAYSLRAGSVLRRTVMCVDEKNRDKIDNNTSDLTDIDNYTQKKESITELAFYIPEDKVDFARRRFKVKGNGIVALIISIAVCSVLLFLLLVFGPWLIKILDSSIANF